MRAAIPKVTFIDEMIDDSLSAARWDTVGSESLSRVGHEKNLNNKIGFCAAAGPGPSGPGRDSFPAGENERTEKPGPT